MKENTMKLFALVLVALLSGSSMALPATLTVTVPDNVSTNLILQISNTYNYAEKKKNGETRKQFVERLLAIHLRELYRAIKMEADAQAARASANATTNGEFPEP